MGDLRIVGERGPSARISMNLSDSAQTNARAVKPKPSEAGMNNMGLNLDFTTYGWPKGPRMQKSVERCISVVRERMT